MTDPVVPQQILCARIALRKHGGPTQDENGCACEHCVALRELIAEVKRLDEEIHTVRNQANVLTLKLRLKSRLDVRTSPA